MQVTWLVRVSSKRVAATDSAAEAADDAAAAAALATDANQDDMNETMYNRHIVFGTGRLNRQAHRSGGGGGCGKAQRPALSA